MKNNISRSLNLEAILKIIVLSGFSLLFITTIVQDKALYYVSPRIVTYMKLCLLVMVILIIFTLKDVFKIPRNPLKITPYLIFIIPLIMAFIIPPVIMTSNSLSQSSSYITSNSKQRVQGNKGDNLIEGNNGEQESIRLERQPGEIKEQVFNPTGTENNTIVVEDANYVLWLNEIYSNYEQHIDKTIEIIGFVFHDPALTENQFILGRYAMTCCAADMQMGGIMVEYEKSSSFELDTWFKVVGTIKEGDYRGDLVPVIIGQSLVKIEKPQSQYVYP